MTAIVWDQAGSRLYESGVDRVVLYTGIGAGQGVAVPWNGVVSIDESPTGGEQESYYFDGNKYWDEISNEDYQSTLTALSSPPEFAPYDGVVQPVPGLMIPYQPRGIFHLSYRTLIGSDSTPALGYKIHCVYNITASPASRSHKSLTESVEVVTKAWQLNAVPVLGATTYKNVAKVVIDSTKTTAAKLAAVEANLYGTAGSAPFLQTIASLITTLT